MTGQYAQPSDGEAYRHISVIGTQAIIVVLPIILCITHIIINCELSMIALDIYIIYSIDSE
jgi:hypothetical protein